MTPRHPTRREFLQLSAAALLPGVSLVASAAPDPSRLALVIGNDAYPQARLHNAVNDATAMATLLRDAGFDADLRTDIDRAGMADATRKFTAAAARSDVKFVFFYYAGHGTQLDWRNYLLPVDAQVNTAADLSAQCLDLAALLGELARAKGKTFVIVLDACRDNPFGTPLRAQKGLSQFDAPPGSLLAFSTAPGSVAADGGGQSGLYTENLVRELSVRATRLEDALKRVRLAVRVASRGAQIPWESTSLESDVFLFPAAKKLSEAELEQAFQRELETWNRIKGSKETKDWVAYLRDYPSGRFAEIAQSRLMYFAAREEAVRAAIQIAAVPAQPLAAQGAAPTIATPAIVLAEARGREPAQLEITQGREPPVLMRPSANPNSAGTYALDRYFSVGDEVVYARSDPVYGGPTSLQALRVTQVDLEADRIDFNDGFIVLDSMGNARKFGDSTFEPRLQSVPSELQVGRKWTTRYMLSDRNGSSESYYDYQVVRRERVKLPFGEIEAFLVEAQGFNLRWGTRLTLSHWLVPGVNVSLRTETKHYDGRSLRVVYADLREMISCRQQRWRQA